MVKKIKSGSFFKKVSLISIFINIVTISILVTIVYRQSEEYYQKYINRKRSADVAMFGDSFTEGGKWNSILHNGLVLRMGWSGYTTTQLAGMIHKTIAFKPRFVFILCGRNDIRSRCFSLDITISNYKFMADTLRINNITPVFQKLLYQHNNPYYNLMIDSINNSLSEFCYTENLELLDIGRDMYDSTGLRADLTTDGLHLNTKGYKLWADIINEYLKNHSNY
jgi:lysophospholipase L1-like esterase